MFISDTHRLAFIHIPKCAGTTVRNALAPYDEHADRFFDRAVFPHPVLGALDYPHIPLAVLNDHFPEDFAKLREYRSFALVRDPVSRFPSSLHERFVQQDRRPLSQRDPTEIAREVDKVLALLANHPADQPITDPGLIHFSRQRDYIFLDGQQIVTSPRSIAEVDHLLDELSAIIGQRVQPEESKNRRIAYTNPTIERLQTAITRPIEKALPRRIWKPAFKPIKAAFQAVGLIQKSRNPLLDLPNAAEITAFVRMFYAGDIKLFEELQGRVEAHSLQKVRR